MWEKKVSRANIIKTELLAEETIVLLAKHAPEGSRLHINTTKVLGDVCVELYMKGEEFAPDINLEAASDNPDDAEDEASEDAIRSILLKAFGEKYKYSHINGLNRVRIIAEPG